MKTGLAIFMCIMGAAIAELTIWLTYRSKVDKYVALCRQIEEAEKRIRDINKAIPAYLTAADLRHAADYIDLAFATQLYYMPGDDPEREDIRKVRWLVYDTVTQLASEREEKETRNETRD